MSTEQTAIPRRVVMQRKRVFVCTDPQRRCYDGYMEGYTRWGPWQEFLEMRPYQDEEKVLEYWRGLTAYAAKERKERISTEYKIETVAVPRRQLPKP